METARVHNNNEVATRLAHLTALVAEGKVCAEDLLANGKRKAQRLARKGFELGEDCLHESKLYINTIPGGPWAWRWGAASWLAASEAFSAGVDNLANSHPQTSKPTNVSWWAFG